MGDVMYSKVEIEKLERAREALVKKQIDLESRLLETRHEIDWIDFDIVVLKNTLKHYGEILEL